MTYSEQWWDDMPEAAHKFATKLGYNKEKWDADSTIPYDNKTFFQCTDEEKQAAMFLGLSPIDKKLNVWWSDLDQTTKDHAKALGWSEDKWDDDWEIYHLEIDKKYWDELDKTQQKAANHFGYTKATWDETYAEGDMKTTKMFVLPKKNHVAAAAAANGHKKTQSQQPAATNVTSKVSTEEEKEDSKWNILDSCCFAPYKVLFAPATMVVKAVANKVK